MVSNKDKVRDEQAAIRMYAGTFMEKMLGELNGGACTLPPSVWHIVCPSSVRYSPLPARAGPCWPGEEKAKENPKP